MTNDFGKGKVKSKCSICNRDIKFSKSLKRKFCSQQCYHVFKLGRQRPAHSAFMKGKAFTRNKKYTLEARLRISGTNHWRYGKGKGFNIIKDKIRRLVEYNQWRLSVYKRDNFTCQNCGKNNVRLECHHKISLANIIYQFNLKDTIDALSCKLLWDVDNGLTLCKPCHKITDSYGIHVQKKVC